MMDEMKQKYNLVMIVPDQLRKDYLGCYGNRNVSTPNIDRIAADGIKFNNMYCAAPLCGPSRCSLATSTYFSEHNHRDYGSEIDPRVPNLVTSMKSNGYRTGMFGKNHLFTRSKLNEVWDELDEVCLGNYDGIEGYDHSYSGFTLPKNHRFNITQKLTDEGIDFIRRNKEKPYLLWMNYQDPHPAFCCPPPYDTMFSPDDIEFSPAVKGYDKDRQPVRNEVFRIHSEMDRCSDDDLKNAIAHYMGQIKYVDDNVGRLVDEIHRSGKKTIILFMSDHGELLGDYSLTHKNPTFYECLSHIPAIIVDADGKWKGLEYDGLAEEVDIVPTLLDMLGIVIPPTMVGKSMYQAIERRDFSGKDTILCEAGGGGPTCKEPIPGLVLKAPFIPTSLGPGAMIRKKNFKLSVYYDDRCELYDLDSDPYELDNLFDCPQYAAIQNCLTLELAKRLIGVKVRDTGRIDWDNNAYPVDVRFEPLEN